MELEEQEALLAMWRDFLGQRKPSGILMRAFYFEVVSFSRHYRYGLAAELFDLLNNGIFDLDRAVTWSLAQGAADEHDDHRAA